MLLFAYDYEGNKKEFTVDDEFDYIEVNVITGDEVIRVWRNGGPGKPPTCIAYCDSSESRFEDFNDFSYFVARDEVDDWLKRKTVDDLRW